METIIVRKQSHLLSKRSFYVFTKTRKEVGYNQAAWPVLASDMWVHTLYLAFYKQDFPEIETCEKQLVSENSLESEFLYMQSEKPLLNLSSFHCGVSFYEERIYSDSMQTLITVGCDFMHSGDEAYYWKDDRGEEILNTIGDELAKEFSILCGEKLCAHESTHI